MYPEIPKDVLRIRGETKVRPAGCSCGGCCAVLGLKEPQYGWKIVSWGKDFEYRVIYEQDEANKEEIAAINAFYGLNQLEDGRFPVRYFIRYFDELKRSMEWLGEKSDTIFLGQAVEYAGTAMFNTLKDVDPKKRIELPVAEAMQMGMTTGLALNGYVPISVYPRWNFLLLATDGLVNHLDKYPVISDYKTKAIIRTSVGSVRPLDPQAQHKGNFSDAFRRMLRNIEIIELTEPEEIFPAYQKAYEREDGKSTILVEYGDFYNEK